MNEELPDGWHFVPEDHAAIMSAELAKEIGPSHVLFGQQLKLIARRYDRDDVLVELQDGRVAEVHMTWSGKQEGIPALPKARLFQGLDVWRASPQYY